MESTRYSLRTSWHIGSWFGLLSPRNPVLFPRPKKAFLHLRKLARKVTMYLYGAQFHPAFYTELGSHSHSLSAHSHSIDHGHRLYVDVNEPQMPSQKVDLDAGGTHAYSSNPYVEPFSGSSGSSGAGQTGLTGVEGGALSATVKTYLNGMKVIIDGTDRTGALLAQAGFSSFGDGTSSHVFNTTGSGLLDLTGLATWGAGEHSIRFEQPGAAGGRIDYYIYVEEANP